MKICCLIASLRIGGAERQLVGLASFLRDEGQDVEILTYREGDFYLKELERTGVKHTRIPSDGGDLAIIKRISAHLRQSGCEVLISFLTGPNIKACMVKRLCPEVKLIVSERNTTFFMLPNDAVRFSFYRRADAVVCNSYAQAGFLRKHRPFLRSKLHAIPNFVDTARFSPVSRPAKDVLEVVTTAQLVHRKNALGLIRAIADANCERLHFDWYGELGSSRYSRRCKALVEKLGLTNRISFHPATNDVESIYARADAFCLPSFFEGTSNSMAEAMACGLPVVCSDVSDNRLYINPGENGLIFNPHREQEIAECLRRLVSTPAGELGEWGLNGRRCVEEKLSKELFVKRYLALIKGLSGGKE